MPELTPDRKPYCVGLIGPAGIGKSTIAAEVVRLNRTPFDIKRMSFADPIRQSLSSVGITKEASLDAYRRLAQKMGDEGRSIDPDFWVNKTLQTQEYKKACRWPLQILLFDDIRYPNEVEKLDLAFVITASNRPLPYEPWVYEAKSEALAMKYHSRLAPGQNLSWMIGNVLHLPVWNEKDATKNVAKYILQRIGHQLANRWEDALASA